jgi:hypothetical protein
MFPKIGPPWGIIDGGFPGSFSRFGAPQMCFSRAFDIDFPHVPVPQMGSHIGVPGKVVPKFGP